MDLNDYIDLSCFTNKLQNFLICASIHKARDLKILNADTFIVTTFNNTSKRTSVSENSDSPVFNEYFVFDVNMRLTDLLKKNITFVLYHKTGCARRNVPQGELIIDCLMIWNELNHRVYKKWGILSSVANDNNASDEAVGYLQIDLMIVSKYEKPSGGIVEGCDYDDIEENMLVPNSLEMKRLKVKYNVKIYNGSFVKKEDFYIQVCFAALSVSFKFQ